MRWIAELALTAVLAGAAGVLGTRIAHAWRTR